MLRLALMPPGALQGISTPLLGRTWECKRRQDGKRRKYSTAGWHRDVVCVTAWARRRTSSLDGGRRHCAGVAVAPSRDDRLNAHSGMQTWVDTDHQALANRLCATVPSPALPQRRRRYAAPDDLSWTRGHGQIRASDTSRQPPYAAEQRRFGLLNRVSGFDSLRGRPCVPT